MKVANCNKFSKSCSVKGFVLLFLSVAICYSNTLNASWHFDDYIRIVENKHIHLENINLQTLKSVLYYFDDPAQIYRPLPTLSFAFNWYFGADNVVGYHLVNIAFHVISSFFLFLSIIALAKAPNIGDLYKNNSYQIALLSSMLWAIHPAQTQAVTYIVQRMAVLAAMFYIIGIFCYIKARLSKDKIQRCILYSASILFYFCALLSKENAILMPFSLLLIEVVFFSPTNFLWVKKFFSIKGILLLFLMTLCLLFLSLKISDNFRFVFEGYDVRPFSLKERLLTQPRIVVQYILQLFYPLQSRFSIEHDVMVSTSLTHPFTTLPSILFNGALIFMAIWKYKKWPLVSFAVLFFYLNHIVESSFIPLEMMFDHRNYLPSFFIFLPVSVGIVHIIEHFRQKSLVIFMVLVGSVVCSIIALGVGTYIRNSTWATQKKIWEDAHLKYPELGRPYQVLAKYYKNRGDYDIAIQLYKKAVPLKFPMLNYGKNLSYNNIGNIYMAKGQFKNAISYYKLAESADPKNQVTLYNISSAYAKVGRYENADLECYKLFKFGYFNAKNFNLKGFVLLKKGEIKKAVSFLEKALKLAPNDINILINLGCAYLLNGKYDQASTIWQKAYTINPSNINILLGQIETLARSKSKNNENKLRHYIENLMYEFSIEEIESSIYNFETSNVMPTIQFDMTKKLIIKRVQ